MKAIKRMLRIPQQTDNAVEVVQKTYAWPFNKRVLRYPIFRAGDWVYLNRPSVWKGMTTESTSEDPLRKLASKKEGSYQAIKLIGHTVMINVKDLHNTLRIDRVALASKAQRT